MKEKTMEEYIAEVFLDEIRVSPFQPRRFFSEEEIEELSQSIKAVGLIHPPVVRKIENKGKILYYELIAGERRWRAVKMAGFEKIKVIVRESSDENAARATLIENVQRVDLNPIEMARAFQQLILVFKMTQEDVALKVGKMRSTIANYLRLLSLPGPIQESLIAGEISVGHAKTILSLENQDLKDLLHDLIRKEKLSVREAEEKSLEIKEKEKVSTKSASKKDGFTRDMEENLTRYFKTKVEIKKGKDGSGKLLIHYFGNEDLNRVIDLFSVSS